MRKDYAKENLHQFVKIDVAFGFMMELVDMRDLWKHQQ